MLGTYAVLAASKFYTEIELHGMGARHLACQHFAQNPWHWTPDWQHNKAHVWALWIGHADGRAMECTIASRRLDDVLGHTRFTRPAAMAKFADHRCENELKKWFMPNFVGNDPSEIMSWKLRKLEKSARPYNDVQALLDSDRGGEAWALLMRLGQADDVQGGNDVASQGCSRTVGDQLLVNVAFHGSASMLELLLQNKANPSARGMDWNGKHTAAIRVAVHARNLEKTKLLLNYRADPSLRMRHSNDTLLHEAAFYGQLEIVKLLVAAGAPPELVNNDGCTFLGAACESDRVEEFVQYALSAHLPVFTDSDEVQLRKKRRKLCNASGSSAAAADTFDKAFEESTDNFSE